MTFFLAAANTTSFTPLLLTAFLVICGTIGGYLAKRFGLPVLTGQIFLGIILGSSCLGILGHAEEKIMAPITQFAIGLIAMTVGAHLNFRRLHNSYKRILFIAFSESLLAFGLVFFSFQYFNPFNFAEYAVPIHLLIASIACATSPASALHIIKEKKAKGLLTKTMVGVIAVDNLICLIVFEICRSFAKQEMGSDSIFTTILEGLSSFAINIFIGVAIGWGLKTYSHLLHRKYSKRHNESLLNTYLFSATLVAIALAYGVCVYVNDICRMNGYAITLSPLMANLILGLVLANTTKHKDHLLAQFDIMEQAVFSIFFIIAGLHLNLNLLNNNVIKSIVIYLLAMAIGKYVGAYIGAIISSSTQRVAKHIGRTLLVQAGMSIALVVVMIEDPIFGNLQFIDEIAAALLTCVVVTEFIGTILISKTLDVAKETGKGNTRLIEFLDEEFILSNLYAKDRFEAIEELCYFMVKTHRMDMSTEDLKDIVLEREKKMSTAIGEGIAVPHGRLNLEGDEISGVLALVDPPLDFEAIDGIPVSILILIITPKSHDDRYLQVISSISKIMQKKEIRNAIINAKSSAEIYEIIHSEELEDINYFIGENEV